MKLIILFKFFYNRQLIKGMYETPKQITDATYNFREMRTIIMNLEPI